MNVSFFLCKITRTQHKPVGRITRFGWFKRRWHEKAERHSSAGESGTIFNLCGFDLSGWLRSSGFSNQTQAQVCVCVGLENESAEGNFLSRKSLEICWSIAFTGWCWSVMKDGGICPPHYVHSGDIVGFAAVKCVEKLNEHLYKKGSS